MCVLQSASHYNSTPSSRSVNHVHRFYQPQGARAKRPYRGRMCQVHHPQHPPAVLLQRRIQIRCRHRVGLPPVLPVERALAIPQPASTQTTTWRRCRPAPSTSAANAAGLQPRSAGARYGRGDHRRRRYRNANPGAGDRGRRRGSFPAPRRSAPPCIAGRRWKWSGGRPRPWIHVLRCRI